MTLLNTEYPFLLGRPVTSMAFAPDQTSVLVTAHGVATNVDPDATMTSDLVTARTFLCVWNVAQPSRPGKVSNTRSYYNVHGILQCIFKSSCSEKCIQSYILSLDP